MSKQEARRMRGWWFPANSRKAHYMMGTRSMCGKWSTLGVPTAGMYSDELHNSPDNCAECRRRRDKHFGDEEPAQ